MRNAIKKIEWIMPEILESDLDLNNEDELNKKYFGDNLEIKITTKNGKSFKTSRRFIISMSEKEIFSLPQDGWNWDEHCELEEDERKLLFDLYEENGKMLLPTDEFLIKLHKKFHNQS